MKKLLSFIMVLTITIGMVAGLGINVSAGTTGVLTYTISDGEVTITKCDTSASGALEIPSTIEGYPVTSIGNSAFESCSSLTSITIPNSVTSIDNYDLFANCDSLISISVKNDNPKYYSEGNCIIEKETGKMILGCNNSVIPEGVKILGYNAFCEITNFQHLTIPASLVEIEDRAITFCNLQSITVAEGNPVYYSEANCLIRKEDNCLILGCNNSVIPNGITGIYDEAFMGYTGLTSVTIPDSVTSIGFGAFFDCEGLNEVHITDIAAWCQLDIGDGGSHGPLRSAGNLYLNGEKVESLVIPDGVTKIGSGVFAGCTNITNVTIPSSVIEISYCAFDDCTNLTNVYYTGTEEQWNNITIAEDNDALLSANKSYEVAEPTVKPTVSPTQAPSTTANPTNKVVTQAPNTTVNPTNQAVATPNSEVTVTSAPQSNVTVTNAPQSNVTVTSAPQTDGTVPDVPQTDGTVTNAPQADGTVPDVPQTDGTNQDAPQTDPQTQKAGIKWYWFVIVGVAALAIGGVVYILIIKKKNKTN